MEEMKYHYHTKEILADILKKYNLTPEKLALADEITKYKIMGEFR